MMYLYLFAFLELGTSSLEVMPAIETKKNTRICQDVSETISISDTNDTLKSTQGYLRDLDTLKVWVEKLHPLPFSRLTKEEWDAACEKAKVDVATEGTELAMTLATGAMLGMLKDSHTMISLGTWAQEKVNSDINTLTLSSIDGDVYVKDDDRGLIAPGTKITSINNLPILDVFNNAKTISPQEGEAWLSRVRTAEYMILPMAMAMTENPDQATTINGQSYYFKKKNIISNWINKRDTKLNWEFNDRLAWLEIGSFMSGSTRRYYKELHRGFKMLKKHGDKWGIRGLVVDLRGNLGGVAYRMKDVIHYLTKEKIAVPVTYIKKQTKESAEMNRDRYRGVVKWIVDRWGNEKNGLVEIKRIAQLDIGEVDTIRYNGAKLDIDQRFEGPVVILMDGLSSSASVSFVAEFNRLNRGVVIGEPCNGPRTGTFSDAVERELPESKLKVMISTGRFIMDKDLKFRSRPITPSRWIQWSEMDLVEKNDPYNNAVLDWINNTEVGNLNKLRERESKVLWEELETVFSRERLWGNGVRKDVWYKVVEGDRCIQKAKSSESNFKQCKTSRNMMIKSDLPQTLSVKFEELIAPSRPAVLHFGIHNRMDCNVCKTN